MKEVVITTREQLAEVVAEELPRAIIAAQRANPDKCHTIKEVAKILGKAENTIRRMIKHNRLAVTADGRYISRKAIDEYLTPPK